MIFNILIYAFPAMFMILGAYLLIYRRTLLEVFGDYSNKVIIIFSVLLSLVGILGFILVVNNLIDLMLIWMLAALLVVFFMVFVFYWLFKANNGKK
ncbi:hypothetical protein FEZ33_06680 [Ruoffia tabacinasalis]|uniref:Uncharacterized protein n=2 Tax=Ruoffia tabacinasalis TaxID=87458 RepID=A0A5R9DUK4_9LACT|nr:hypothetical protein [Ruoffia tabacinasalis]TLQ41063.1 hypothetical protein FEZ33_06680 [Ruoffia tabacinasalis]